MSIFYETFSERIKNLWHQANRLNKPIRNDISWTFGVVRGRADFADLQAHGIALASSIIITEDTIPPIICAWDTPDVFETLYKDKKLRDKTYPRFLLECFGDPVPPATVQPDPPYVKVREAHLHEYLERKTKYASLHRYPYCVGAHPLGLGFGYRTKYHGLDYVLTDHAIMSDIDTICIDKCVDYLMDEVKKGPNTFCLTNWQDASWISVGLVVFNMLKYRMIYKPYFNRMYWDTRRADSTFVKSVLLNFPHLKDQLDIREFDKHKINTEKFSLCQNRGNFWEKDKTVHYHAWKGEMDSNKDEFLKYYGEVLTKLETSVQEQLSVGCIR
jgi:hypothetical protein